MKVNLNQPIPGVNGEPISVNGKEQTYSKLIVSCLDVARQEDSADEKIKKFRLALKCSPEIPEDEPDKEVFVDLSVDERKLIKEAVHNAGCTPTIYGRISQLFEESDEE